jgi:hypothetical protein
MSSDGDSGQDGYFNLPDNIIGIGNAGKTTVKHYLSQDWILKEGVEKRNGNTPDGFNAFIIDTATNEQDKDENQVEEINDRIKRIARQSGRPEDTVSTELEYINPLDDAPNELISRPGLTSETTVRKIANKARIDAWWLENNDTMLTDGYAQGVLRRRGLSKALFHASRTDEGRMEALHRRIDGKTATMVVGLGGGTGSGMFLDLAKLITDEVDEVHLIATIPGLQEKDRRTANAFAALSELEYLALQGDNPFTNIVVVPFGPARDLENRETFHDALVQTIVAREATSNNFSSFLDESKPNRIPKAYAPFTVAVPQILRYDVGDIREIASNIETYRKEKRAALDAELSLYESLHEFFIDEWSGDVGDALEKAQQAGLNVNDDQFSLSGEEASALRNRLDELQSWIEDEQTFGHVNNQALADWRDQLGGWVKTHREQTSDLSDEEFKKHLVTTLPDRVENLKPVDDKYPAEPDERRLAEVFRDELRAIKLRANLLRVIKIIDEDEVREALNSAIHTDRDGWVGGMSLADRINTLEQQTDSHERNLNLLTDLESDLETMRDHRAESWQDAVADDMELLVELQNHADEIESQLSQLQDDLKDVFRTITNANDPSEIPANAFSFDFGLLNDRLQKVGLDPVDRTAIEDTVKYTKKAYETWHELNNTGFVRDLLGKKEELQDEYVGYLDGVDRDLVTIEPTAERGNFEQDFECSLAAEDLFGDVAADLEEKRDRRLESVISEFESTIGEFDVAETVEEYRTQWNGDGFDLEWPGDAGEAPDELRERLSTGLDEDSAADVFDALLADGSGYRDEGIVHRALDDAFLGPVEAKRAALQDRIEETDRRTTIYQDLREIVMEHDDSFSDTGPDRPDSGDTTSYVSSSESPYLKKTKSEDQSGLLQYEDIAASRIWDRSDSKEMQKIRSHFEQFAENVVENNETLGLQRRRIEIKTGASGDYADVRNTVYDGHYIGNVFMSRTFETDQQNPGNPIFKQVQETFDQSKLHFESNANGYSHESIGFGAPWDLSMVTFVGGVFLDNIRAILQPNRGYKNSYESQREELREAVRIRHVHGVDGTDHTIGGDGEGGFVYRDSLLNLDDPEDLYTLLDATEEEMVETLLEDHVGERTFRSTIDLTADE